jgi:hypothetical protein
MGDPNGGTVATQRALLRNVKEIEAESCARKKQCYEHQRQRPEVLSHGGSFDQDKAGRLHLPKDAEWLDTE